MHRELLVRLRDERGFTLVEMMVALAIGLVVSTATLAIVIVSVHLSSNYTDRVDANQTGRLAMEKITQALTSSCVLTNQAPVLAGSTATSLVFYSALNDTPGPVPSQVTVSIASTQPAPLLMTTQSLTGTPPNWVASSQAPQVYTLAAWAGQSGSTPMFQYYPYAAGGVVSTTPFTVGANGLTAAQAAATAQVAITYQVLPTDKWQDTAGRQPVVFSDAVVFRLTPPSSAPSAPNLPCT